MNNGMQRDDVDDAFVSSDSRNTVPVPSVTQLAPTQRYDVHYNMNHSKRGVAFIFNHEFFIPKLHLEPRDGTNVDCEKLTLTLKNLGFEVNDFHNLTHKDLVKQLKRAAEMDHSEHDCLVIAVLSHGKLGLLYAHDTTYKADSLWHYFTADKCQSLAGKPKLFFIQACQGDKLDPGIKLKERTEMGEVRLTSANFNWLSSGKSPSTDCCDWAVVNQDVDKRDTPTETDGLFSTFRILTQADFLIAYSTIPGYYSWRNTSRGSWFMQALCMELRENGTRSDLLTVLTSVCQCVALDFETNTPNVMFTHRQKQIPCITTTLTRLVKFTSPENRVV